MDKFDRCVDVDCKIINKSKPDYIKEVNIKENDTRFNTIVLMKAAETMDTQRTAEQKSIMFPALWCTPFLTLLSSHLRIITHTK